MTERAEGPALKRVGLFVEGRQPVREGAIVVDVDGQSRWAASPRGGFSPSLQAPIAMAYIPAHAAIVGHGDHPRTARQAPSRRHGRRHAVRRPSLSPSEERPSDRYFTRRSRMDQRQRHRGCGRDRRHHRLCAGQLGDIVFVEVPPAGTAVAKGEEAAVVESVKAASDVYAPVSGDGDRKRTAALEDDPCAGQHTRPRTDGWFFRPATHRTWCTSSTA